MTPAELERKMAEFGHEVTARMSNFLANQQEARANVIANIQRLENERIRLENEPLDRLIALWKAMEQKAADTGLLQERVFATHRIRLAEETRALECASSTRVANIASLRRDLEWFEMEMAKVELQMAQEARAAQLEAEGDPMDID